MEAYNRCDFGTAMMEFDAAIEEWPDTAYSHFATRSSAAVAGVLHQTKDTSKVVARFDALPSSCQANLLADYPKDRPRISELRDANIAAGLPSVAVITQGKSASMPVQNIFSSGFELPSFAYSIVHLEVVGSWARDFARGGACYTTHLRPLRRNVARLKEAHVDKIIVHVRDPRQRLLSMIHHVLRYSDAGVNLKNNSFADLSISEQIEALIEFYTESIWWLQSWLRAAEELDIHFSTFKDFVTDRESFIQGYIDYYGHESLFSYEKATTLPGSIDDRYRAGQIDEWRRKFPPDDIARLNDLLPDFIKERFGWTD